MKKGTPYILILVLLSFSKMVISQVEWEAKAHFAGYINAVTEYCDNPDFDNKFSSGISELGFLSNHKPFKNIELKGTLVYNQQTFFIDQILMEAYGIFHMDEMFKIGLGRFVTPLSPINLYFYEPLNTMSFSSVQFSQNQIFPQNITGIQLAGEYKFQGDIK